MKAIIKYRGTRGVPKSLILGIKNMNSIYAHKSYHGFFISFDISIIIIIAINIYKSQLYNRINKFVMIPFKDRINKVGMLNLMIQKLCKLNLSML